jgi:UDP-glucuronate 4-epimerase
LLASTQVFPALKKRGDGGVVGIDNFNSYYDISLKRSAGQEPIAKHRLFGD